MASSRWLPCTNPIRLPLLRCRPLPAKSFSLDLFASPVRGKDPERVEDMAERVRRFCEIAGVSRLAVLDGKGRTAAWPVQRAGGPARPSGREQAQNAARRSEGLRRRTEGLDRTAHQEPDRSRCGERARRVRRGGHDRACRQSRLHARVPVPRGGRTGRLFVSCWYCGKASPLSQAWKGCLIIPLLVGESLSFFSSGARSFLFWRKTPATPKRLCPLSWT